MKMNRGISLAIFNNEYLAYDSQALNEQTPTNVINDLLRQLDDLQQSTDYGKLVYTTLRLAKIYYEQGFVEHSIEKLFLAQKISERHQFFDYNFYMQWARANIYFMLKQYGQAHVYVNKAKQIAYREKSFTALINVFSMERMMYSAQARHEEALQCAKLAVYFAHKLTGYGDNYKIQAFTSQLAAYAANDELEKSNQLYEFLLKNTSLASEQMLDDQIQCNLYCYLSRFHPSNELDERIRNYHQQLETAGLKNLSFLLSEFMINELMSSHSDYRYYYIHYVRSPFNDARSCIRIPKLLNASDERKRIKESARRLKFYEEQDYFDIVRKQLVVQPLEKIVMLAVCLQCTEESLYESNIKSSYHFFSRMQQVLETSLPNCIVGKFDAYEYCIAAVVPKELHVEQVFEKLLIVVRDTQIILDGQTVAFDAKVGVASREYENSYTPEVLYSEADSAMYYAMRYGNPIVAFTKVAKEGRD